MIVYRGYCAVGLAHPKTPANVGHALRACGAFGAAFLAYTGSRYSKAPTDPQKAFRHMPLLRAGDNPEDVLQLVPYDCIPVAVELTPDARPLERYVHPERAFYIFGPEDGSLGRAVLSRCRDVVQIQSRFCLNLAAAVNVVLYDRVAKGTANNARFENGAPL